MPAGSAARQVRPAVAASSTSFLMNNVAEKARVNWDGRAKRDLGEKAARRLLDERQKSPKGIVARRVFLVTGNGAARAEIHQLTAR